MSLIVAGGIAAGAALAGQGINAMAQSSMNKRTRQWNERMYALQRQNSLQDWHMQNQYNSPTQQQQRIKDAGLNPHLMYGQGTVGQADQVKQPTAPNWNPKAPQMDLGAVAQQAIMYRQAEANIARTEAETQAIQSRTVSQDFQNQVNQIIGIDNMAERYKWASEEIAIKSQKANAQWEQMKAVGYNHKFDDPNSPSSRAMKAGYEQAEVELQNAKRLGDIREFEATIKAFEANLTKQGIAPGTPWYFKILGDLLGPDLRQGHDSYKNFIQNSNPF